MPTGVCGCCGPLRPRYKRLVDNIFPEDPKDGLVKSDMEKLTFYAVSAPEKLDRIGAYLAERLSRDVVRHRYGYVVIAMEALDQLLMACHSQSIKPFVESFLHMVAKLLESREPDLQVLGTNSFVKFANIEEDTPSYHRRYDFFVSQFSAMCHSTHEDPETRNRIRVAGIKGLQGVVRKTVNDELQAIIWEPQHMDKLIPSMLFNMQDNEDFERTGEENPASLAESCFRELLGRAAYGNMNNAVHPVLVHLDNHRLWDPNDFAVSCFRIIMYSIQAQHSHHVIQQVLSHLDTHSKNTPRVRAGIVQVLLETVAIAAKGSIGHIAHNQNNAYTFLSPVSSLPSLWLGPTVLEVFNTLLKHLRMSVDFELGDGSRRNSASSLSSTRTKESEERIVQNAIIQTIGFFGGNLPDYQRAEVMMFVMGKVPVYGTPCHTLDTVKIGHQGTKRIQAMLLSSLIMVTSGFKCKTICAGLPMAFLEPLCSISLMEDSELRLLVLEILHNIIDRHDNRAKLRGIRIIPNVAALKIKREKISKQDVVFMKKHGQQLYRHIYLGCKEEDNVQKNFELLFTALALITIELANEEVVIDLIRLSIALQDMALANEENMPMFIRCGIMALVAAYLNFLSQMIANPPFCQHVSKVIEMRNLDAPHLLPEHVFREKCVLPDNLDRDDVGLYFQTADLAEALSVPGYNVERLAVPYIPQVTVLYTVGKILHRCRQTSRDQLPRRKSFVDTISLQVDILSNSLPDQSQLAEEITFETLKKAIDTTGLEEQERERRRQVMEKFQKAPFEEIAAHCESKANMLHDRLAQVFELTIRPPPSPSGTVTVTSGHAQYQSVPVYEMKFPDLCVY
ncbi:protein EFR3 homolog A-like isoform X4 [Sinocyclocheilus anshuiensis]|uniref:protein EFR3 homolog A-like isoform X3 n=1 Tax=Sinocyclocheilus anshuiensis TaxID=1608454 RepID=UPI0007B8F1D6|nr:PREDICTED: protein EFR3 homolog A-like isoform X3 [Sinocyclocheilus anshuiensis]XP_016309034.1 PREDICTED: protein EFR3 homolog A-like isoform X4 [Sinocyclocheilus anshuiensis]